MGVLSEDLNDQFKLTTRNFFKLANIRFGRGILAACPEQFSTAIYPNLRDLRDRQPKVLRDILECVGGSDLRNVRGYIRPDGSAIIEDMARLFTTEPAQQIRCGNVKVEYTSWVVGPEFGEPARVCLGVVVKPIAKFLMNIINYHSNHEMIDVDSYVVLTLVSTDPVTMNETQLEKYKKIMSLD